MGFFVKRYAFLEDIMAILVLLILCVFIIPLLSSLMGNSSSNYGDSGNTHSNDSVTPNGYRPKDNWEGNPFCCGCCSHSLYPDNSGSIEIWTCTRYNIKVRADYTCDDYYDPTFEDLKHMM